jgi:prophage DNA circulation protein
MSDVTTVSEITVTAPKTPQAVGPQTASFRGVPFGVFTDEGDFGRELAVHKYPKRKRAWAEDMGLKAPRPFMLSGFLLTDSLVYGGGDVLDQLSAMIVAAETEGPGTLVHPVLGSLTVACQKFHYARRADASRYVDVDFVFLESGAAVFPSNSASTGDAVDSAGGNVQSAASDDFTTAITPLLPLGSLTQAAVATAIGNWTGQIAAVATDATLIINLAAQLTGNYGRFFNGALGVDPPQTLSATTTIADLISEQTTLRAAVKSASASETSLGGELGVTTDSAASLVTGAQALVTAVAACAANPADAVRLLLNLASYASGATDSATLAIDAMHQRLVVTALALAAEAYQPTSYQDAAALRAAVAKVLDHQITVAGDAGDDESFQALCALKVAVVEDLTARGADLAVVAQFNLAESFPALALAQRLYRDPGRADALTAEINPPNPLFVPANFQALAS